MKDKQQKKDGVDLGACCVCGKSGDGKASGLIPLDYEAPVAGTGWGCTVCGLPPNGLIVVVCQKCIAEREAKSEDGIPGFTTDDFRFGVLGYPVERRRIDLRGFALVPFGHDERLHLALRISSTVRRLRAEYGNGNHRGARRHGDN